MQAWKRMERRKEAGKGDETHELVRVFFTPFEEVVCLVSFELKSPMFADIDGGRCVDLRCEWWLKVRRRGGEGKGREGEFEPVDASSPTREKSACDSWRRIY